ncbi:MAG: hypothetical protein A3G49_05500 [Candidatus Sungbacteria bacterium RIFCSPLOWO2_12_FULL_41_11]|uniref:Uncharacterized protein n=1 Tax=Candidatus Sungbacteria bacterium RIFCSPLOWO2_12_FULL_41_11 TaxID=1802286 RepID=A0A1G2LSN4_9BACT|nr:MAG: hypothetical protein A3G49_05500 [Candidatus Sungbacteria bacterium RIFCSPLOWO2_12_FULL_41_11]
MTKKGLIRQRRTAKKGKNMPKTTNERIQARLDKVSGWVNEVDAEIAAPYHRNTISGADGGAFLVNLALNSSEPVLDEIKMAKLKDRLANAGVSNALPEADPRLMEIKVPETTAPGNPLSGEIAIAQIRQKMLDSFLAELRVLRQVLPVVKADTLAEMRGLVRERRELSGIRKSFRNMLRNRNVGIRAAFERMARGGPNPSWVWSGNVK